MLTTAIDISKALQIDGWMEEAELIWLAEQAQQHHRIVELGSFLGRSTRALGDNTPGFVIAIDDWYGPRELYIPPERRKNLVIEFTANLEDLIRARKVRPVLADHSELDGVVADVLPDMVFIDGDHDYKSAKRDIDFWRVRMSSGDLLCGHDAEDSYVRQAVLDTFENPSVVKNTNIWAVYV